MTDLKRATHELQFQLNTKEVKEQHYPVQLSASDAEKILALLKEQEAVEPEVEVLNEIDRLYRCPRCHKYFFHRKQKYCDQCGQEVKWDE